MKIQSPSSSAFHREKLYEKVSKIIDFIRYSQPSDDSRKEIIRMLTLHIDTTWKLSEYTKYICLLEYCDKSKPLVDWGAQLCHISFLSQILGFKQVIPYCMDDDFPEVKKAISTFFPETFKIGAHANQIDLPTNSVGTLISSGVIEHVQEFETTPEEILKEASRVLEPGGYFVIWKLPNVSAVSEIKSDIIGKWSHEYRYTLRGFERLAKNAGFEVIKKGSEGLLPLRLSVFLRKKLLLRCVDNLFLNMSQIKPFSVFANDHYFILKNKSL